MDDLSIIWKFKAINLPSPPPIPAAFPAYFIYHGAPLLAPSSPPEGARFEKKFCITGPDQNPDPKVKQKISDHLPDLKK